MRLPAAETLAIVQGAVDRVAGVARDANPHLADSAAPAARVEAWNDGWDAAAAWAQLRSAAEHDGTELQQRQRDVLDAIRAGVTLDPSERRAFVWMVVAAARKAFRAELLDLEVDARQRSLS